MIADSDPPARLALSIAWIYVLIAWKQVRCWGWIGVAVWAVACFYIGHPFGPEPPADWHVWTFLLLPAVAAMGIELHWLAIRRRNGGPTPREPPFDPPKP